MIVGVGVDIVPMERLARSLERTPRLRERLFAVSERDAPLRSLAGRFAAKEALIKALGGRYGLTWPGMELLSATSGQPAFRHTEELSRALATRNVDHLHVSLSHDGGFAVAVVVAERSTA